MRAALFAALVLFALESAGQGPAGKVPPQLPPQAGDKAKGTVQAQTAPTVSLTMPAALYTAPAAVLLEAAAAASSGGRSITRVEFFSGTTLIGAATTAPYSFNWNNVAAGSYSLTARATDNLGVASISAPVAIIVNAPPTVNLDSPGNNALFTAPAAITLTAGAADADGSIAQVEFFQGTSLVATVTSAPYTFSLTGVAAGGYVFSARATDDRGAATVSAQVTVMVNAPPGVSLTSPAANATFTAPATIPLSAQALDTDGTIARVDFYNGAELIGALTESPFSTNWLLVPAGSYSLTARVIDNLGATAVSEAISVTVNQALAQIYYIHTDHLSTPRAIFNQFQQLVWQWDNTDPFGGNLPNENPLGLGNFTCNLRFPGQYFDRETNLHYNYFRDYEPRAGRYVQSDPIGLEGGINTFTYGENSPVALTDPIGLKTYRCTKPLDAITNRFGTETSKFAYEYLPYMYHQYSCVVRDGKTTCGGQDFKESPIYGPGKPSSDTFKADRCKETGPDNYCFEECLTSEWKKPRPNYGIPIGTDCQEYDEALYKRCAKKCKIRN